MPLFPPFRYEFPEARFEEERDMNDAQLSAFSCAQTIEDRLRILQATLITMQSVHSNLSGFANDFNVQLGALRDSFDEFVSGVEYWEALLDEANKMAFSLAKYDVDRVA